MFLHKSLTFWSTNCLECCGGQFAGRKLLLIVGSNYVVFIIKSNKTQATARSSAVMREEQHAHENVLI